MMIRPYVADVVVGSNPRIAGHWAVRAYITPVRAYIGGVGREGGREVGKEKRGREEREREEGRGRGNGWRDGVRARWRGGREGGMGKQNEGLKEVRL